MLQFYRGMSSLVKIDGSMGEGGGQVLRIALSLSTLYTIPVEISNIRAGRPKPGLAAQHLKGVELLKSMCNAKVEGGSIGSTHLIFWPGVLHQNTKKSFEVDTETAGCITLLAQIALPCALFLPGDECIKFILKGGTNAPMGPQIEYLRDVFKPLLKKFGGDFDCTVVKRGYYPKGRGEAHLFVKPISSLKAINLTDPGSILRINGKSFVAGVVHANEAQKMIDDAEFVFDKGFIENRIPRPPMHIEWYMEDKHMAFGNGSGINITCTTSKDCVFGGSSLGPSKRNQLAPGAVAASEILYTVTSGSCVDAHAQDQMIIFMALATGVSRVKIGSQKLTTHTETAIKVAELMLSKRNFHFNLIEDTDGPGGKSYVIECEGCGYSRENL